MQPPWYCWNNSDTTLNTIQSINQSIWKIYYVNMRNDYVDMRMSRCDWLSSVPTCLLYSKTCRIRHALEERFCVGMTAWVSDTQCKTHVKLSNGVENQLRIRQGNGLLRCRTRQFLMYNLNMRINYVDSQHHFAEIPVIYTNMQLTHVVVQHDYVACVHL